MVVEKHLLAASLLPLVAFATAHGHGPHGNAGMHMGAVSNSSCPAPVNPNDPWGLPSYSGLEAHSGSMLAHIGFMVAAWFFLLPIGGSSFEASATSS